MGTGPPRGSAQPCHSEFPVAVAPPDRRTGPAPSAPLGAPVPYLVLGLQALQFLLLQGLAELHVLQLLCFGVFMGLGLQSADWHIGGEARHVTQGLMHDETQQPPFPLPPPLCGPRYMHQGKRGGSVKPLWKMPTENRLLRRTKTNAIESVIESLHMVMDAIELSCYRPTAIRGPQSGGSVKVAT